MACFRRSVVLPVLLTDETSPKPERKRSGRSGRSKGLVRFNSCSGTKGKFRATFGQMCESRVKYRKLGRFSYENGCPPWAPKQLIFNCLCIERLSPLVGYLLGTAPGVRAWARAVTIQGRLEASSQPVSRGPSSLRFFLLSRRSVRFSEFRTRRPEAQLPPRSVLRQPCANRIRPAGSARTRPSCRSND